MPDDESDVTDELLVALSGSLDQILSAPGRGPIALNATLASDAIVGFAVTTDADSLIGAATALFKLCTMEAAQSILSQAMARIDGDEDDDWDDED